MKIGEYMPTDWEQDVAEIYVNERQIIRPVTNVKTAFISVLLFVLSTIIFTWILYFILMKVGIISYFPPMVQQYCDENPALSAIILCAIVLFIELFFCLKYAIIGVVKLYQHYAPEEIRRRCLFMPTCSEYTIMAVNKYGCIIGLCKSYYRLVYRCRGNIYQIDYP